MPYVTSIERLGRRKGMCQGIEALLRVRFGEEGLKLMPEIREIHEEEKLRSDPQSSGNRGQPGGSAPAMVAGNALSQM